MKGAGWTRRSVIEFLLEDGTKASLEVLLLPDYELRLALLLDCNYELRLALFLECLFLGKFLIESISDNYFTENSFSVFSTSPLLEVFSI